MAEHEAPGAHPVRDALTHLLHPGGQQLAPAEHTHPDGPAKGWNAADVQPSEYSSDDYAAQFPTVTDPDVEVDEK